MAENHNIIYLVGFMGTGKSTIGRVLAEDLSYEFIDLDDYIEEFTGKAIKDIFSDRGENYFRAIETQCLKDVSAFPKCVVSCGGGVPLNATNRSILMNSGSIIWLDADIDEIIRRVSQNSDRPLVNGKSPDEINRLKLERAPIYNSLGAIKIDTTNKSPSVVCSNIFDVLHL